MHAWTLNFLFLLHNLILIGALIEYFLLNKKLNFILSCLGLLMYFIALFFRNWAIKSLGEYWSINIEIRKPHPILKNGPYQRMRHPAYFAIILEVLGFPLILNSVYTFYFSLSVYVPAILFRLYLEEKELIKQAGNDYTVYREETWSFLPISGKKILIDFIKKNKCPILFIRLLNAC